MARIRTIKPSIWGDAKFAPLSRDARLLMLGLISLADDDGRFIASTTVIAGYVYPHDELPPTKIKVWLKEIEIKSKGMVRFYEIDGLRYGWFPNYRHKHQVINKPQPSPLPAPPGEETLL